MKYAFPTIAHISQVTGVIEGSDEFVIAERNSFEVINYLVVTPSTFPKVETNDDAIRRECRGITFDNSGTVISRPYHKFFNVNEKEETQYNAIDLSQPHVILEKLDGSMIRPIPIEGAYRLATKMGITDVALQAEVFIADKNNYHEFIVRQIKEDHTPIFEWCSRQQRIVLDYPEDRLVLTAIRHIYTGRYLPYSELQELASKYDIDLVKLYPGTAASMVDLVESTKNSTGIEGYVVRFDDGHMLKIKSDEYVAMHHSKDAISREKNVIDMLVNGMADDARVFLQDEDRKRLDQFEDKFWNGVQSVTEQYVKNLETFISQVGNDRRRFALEIVPNIPGMDRQIYFGMWDNVRPAKEVVLNVIRKNVGTQTRIDSVRHLWGGEEWKYT